MAAVNSILQVENLTKSFGDLVLFENISLGLSEGQRVGLIAKNGSGKTTLLNILSGKEGYDNGTISFRRDLRVGYLEQDPQYPEELTVLEACFHHGNSTVELIKEYERCMETEGHPGLDEILVRMDHEKAWEYEQKAKQILSQLKIRDFSQHVKHLSGGQLKRVALANTLITEPDLLILDEPTSGLDPLMQREFFDILGERNKEGATVFLSSHVLSEIQRNCSRAAIIREGRIIACDSVDALSRDSTKRVTAHGHVPLEGLEGIRDRQDADGTVSFLYSGDMNRLLRAFADGQVSDLTVSEPDLEEVFLHYYETADGSREAVSEGSGSQIGGTGKSGFGKAASVQKDCGKDGEEL